MATDSLVRPELVWGLRGLHLPLSVSFETLIAFLSGLDCFSLSFPEYDNKYAPRILYRAVKAGKFLLPERALGEPWWPTLRSPAKCAWMYVCMPFFACMDLGVWKPELSQPLKREDRGRCACVCLRIKTQPTIILFLLTCQSRDYHFLMIFIS